MNRERLIRVPNGWAVLPFTILLLALAIALLVLAFDAKTSGGTPNFWLLGGTILFVGLFIFSCYGYFTLQPNEV